MEQALLGEKASFELPVFYLLILLKLLYFRPSGTFDVIDDDDISNFFADILPKNKTPSYFSSLQSTKYQRHAYKIYGKVHKETFMKYKGRSTKRNALLIHIPSLQVKFPEYRVQDI